MNRIKEHTTNQLSLQPKIPGVTIVTCCMNRNDNLKKALKSWLALTEVHEIIIVDWSSQISVKKTIPHHEKIKIVEVANQKEWILSRAFNLGVCFVSTDKMLKLDADIILAENFLKKHKLVKNMFYHGTWKTAKSFDQIHLHGQLYCFTDDFWNVNGYNEEITSYGWDDDDLYKRLAEIGTRELYFNSSKMFHLHTSNKKRVESQSMFDNKIIDHDLLMESRNKNKENCEIHPWTKSKERINYSVNSISERHFLCERIV